ncbi:MAG: hypothetical protein JWO31_550 [Phycisphaerales bacterium]|nr:hypothetical protein [Phycisphaerales bacterium]
MSERPTLDYADGDSALRVRRRPGNGWQIAFAVLCGVGGLFGLLVTAFCLDLDHADWIENENHPPNYTPRAIIFVMGFASVAALLWAAVIFGKFVFRRRQ